MDEITALWVANGISVGAGILAVLMMQLKNMKLVLLFQILINLIGATNYLLMDGGSGMLLSLTAVIHSIVMYFYNTRGVKPHVPVTFGFIAVYFGFAIYNLIITHDPMEILPALAAFCFSFSLIQKNPSVFRIWCALNPIFWLPYDIYTKSFVMFLVHGGILVSAVVGMIRLDGFLKKKKS